MSDNESIHQAYQRILARAEVRQLAARFGLDHSIRYEFVGERRSFHGQAATVQGMRRVRLACNPRPEPYLLLTLLHEWAHLLEQGQKPGAQRRRVHGREWRRRYASLLYAGMRAGLFPGNEQELARHAAAGEIRTASAQLRGPDGTSLLPTPTAHCFAIGDAVHFVDQRGRKVRGAVRRVNRATITVVVEGAAGAYRVPHSYPSLAFAGARTPSPRPSSPWRVGMTICFTNAAGQPRKGTVVRINLKTLTVDADDGRRYRVGYGHPHLRAA